MFACMVAERPSTPRPNFISDLALDVHARGQMGSMAAKPQAPVPVQVATPRTRALLFGINYVGTDGELNGCINDAENLAEYLVASKFVTQTNVTIVREAKRDEMIRALVALAATTYRETVDTVFISYSGHGTQVADRSRDEADGMDECLCPSDHSTAGLLEDDYLNDILETVNHKTRVVVMMDCCHSGSCMDLPMRFVTRTTCVRDAAAASRCHPKMIMLSGCQDDQTSADAFDAGRAEFTGAMTSAFLDAVKAKPTIVRDAFGLLFTMRSVLKVRGMTQVPQLSTSIAIPSTGLLPFL